MGPLDTGDEPVPCFIPEDYRGMGVEDGDLVLKKVVTPCPAPGTRLSRFDIVLDPSSLDPSVDTLTEIIDLWSGGTNPGIQIYGGDGQWGVDSSESTSLAERPELIIEYTAIPEPSAAILLLGSTLGLFRRSRNHRVG